MGDRLDAPTVSYILGILSIVFGILSPLAGLVLGIIGLRMSGKEKNAISKKAKKYSTIGIVISLILLVLAVTAAIYCFNNPGALICGGTNVI